MTAARTEEEDSPFEALTDEFVYLQPTEEQERRTTCRTVKDCALSIRLVQQKRNYRAGVLKKAMQP